MTKSEKLWLCVGHLFLEYHSKVRPDFVCFIFSKGEATKWLTHLLKDSINFWEELRGVLCMVFPSLRDSDIGR